MSGSIASIIIAIIAIAGRNAFSRNVYHDVFTQGVLIAISLAFMTYK
jgi:hypothetical protein